MTPGRKYSLSSIGGLLWRRKLFFVALTAIGAVGGQLYVSRLPVMYRAGATVLVLPQVVPANYVRATVNQDIDAQVRSLAERVLTRDRIKTLIAAILPKAAPLSDAATDSAVQAIATGTSVQIIRADAFRITFVHRDPAVAAAVATRLAQTFVDENMHVRAGQAEEADLFLETQLTSARQRLEENEKTLEQYRRSYNGQLPSQLSANLQIVQNAQARVQSLDESLHQDRDRKMKLEEAIAALAKDEEKPTADTEPDSEPNVEQLAESALELKGRDAARMLPTLRAALDQLQLRLKPGHPDVVRLTHVIAQLEERASKAGPSTIPAATDAAPTTRRATLARLQSDLAAVEERIEQREAEQAQVQGVIDRYQQRIELTPTRETELATLTRDYDTLRETYQSLLKKKEESEMGAELERRQVGETLKIVEYPTVPSSPYSPRREAIVSGAAAAGLLLTLLVVAAIEYLDVGLRNDQEVLAALDIPVLATVSTLVVTADVRRRRLQRAGLIAGALAIAAGTTLAILRSVGRL